jgi:predicted dinucleotide-binding enzyme
MAFSTVNLVVNNVNNSFTNATAATITLASSDYNSAKTFVQNLVRDGGAFAFDSGGVEFWVPISQIVKIVVT